jgi:beta-xylosidase
MPADNNFPIQSKPVYEDYFADPFVWRCGDAFYAIGTGAKEAAGEVDGNVFPILHSTDLFHWRYLTGALIPPEPAIGTHFWAPEVAFHQNQFFLYYSVGHGDKHHQLRIATSDRAEGPYRDAGRTLLDPQDCPFAIDPHPFRDEDGQWYLFYARDFLEVSPEVRAGTALKVARMRSMVELEDTGRVVVRARSDWQRFQANRTMYERLWDWHTLEGPAVRKQGGRYYCFYSGGRWENDTYGVDYAVADNVLGPYTDQGNETGPRVLKSVPGELIGPGHNSIVPGDNDEADFIAYHAWDVGMKARRMFIDRLVWTPNGPRCQGSSRRAALHTA